MSLRCVVSVTILLLMAIVITGCNENKTVSPTVTDPIEGDWTGTYMNRDMVQRPLTLTLTVDSTVVSGSYIIQMIDTLGTVFDATGGVAGFKTADTAATFNLLNVSFGWTFVGGTGPAFLLSGSWLSPTSIVNGGTFAVSK